MTVEHRPQSADSQKVDEADEQEVGTEEAGKSAVQQVTAEGGQAVGHVALQRIPEQPQRHVEDEQRDEELVEEADRRGQETGDDAVHVLCGEPREDCGQEQEGGEGGAVAVRVLGAAEEGEPSGYQDGGKSDGCWTLDHVCYEQWKWKSRWILKKWLKGKL